MVVGLPRRHPNRFGAKFNSCHFGLEGAFKGFPSCDRSHTVPALLEMLAGANTLLLVARQSPVFVHTVVRMSTSSATSRASRQRHSASRAGGVVVLGRQYDHKHA